MQLNRYVQPFFLPDEPFFLIHMNNVIRQFFPKAYDDFLL